MQSPLDWRNSHEMSPGTRQSECLQREILSGSGDESRCLGVSG